MKKSYLFVSLFWLIVVGYFFLYGCYGINDADDGFTLALSWRIFNGEIPYRDFILVRTPFSPVFHVLTLYLIPENYQVVFERFLFYAMMGLSSLFGAFALSNAFQDDEDMQLDPYVLAAMGFIYSVGSFSPMPWHTVDGVLFASAGALLLTRSLSFGSITFGMLLLTLAALCKQSFYLVPLVGLLYIALQSKDWRRTVYSLFVLVSFVGLYLFMLYLLGALDEFFVFTVGSSKIGDLLSAGVFEYLGLASVYYLAFVVLLIIAVRSKEAFSVDVRWLVPYAFISLLFLYPLGLFVYKVFLRGDDGVYVFYQDKVAPVLFLMSVLLFLRVFRFEKKWMVLYFLVFISWSAGISWGYRSPALFSVPLLFAFLIIARRFLAVGDLRRLSFYLLFMGLVAYFIAYQKPYCNPVRSGITYSLSDVFPKLTHIRVDRDSYEKYRELNALLSRHGDNFKTMPGMPWANYLSGTRAPVSIDWVFNAEMNGREEEVLKELEEKHVVIFMEKRPQLISVNDSYDRFNSRTAFVVKNTWTKIDSTGHFDVYRHR